MLINEKRVLQVIGCNVGQIGTQQLGPAD